MIISIEKSNKLYPPQLQELSVKTLYYRGDISILNDKIIAVIGQRDASERSLAIAYQIGKILAHNGYTILNGLAIGCDKYAAMGAVSENGKVIGVMPSGLDEIYPSSCKQLAQKIVDCGGCLVSQYPEGTPPVKYQFIERDKLQAVIATKIIVVSAKEKGGTMHTVSFAAKSDREIGSIIESKEITPEGNIFIQKKYNATRIFDTDSLMKFVSENKPEQLSFFCNEKAV